MQPKDAELNFRGGPWEIFSLTISFKADKGEFELFGCGNPNRIVTVNKDKRMETPKKLHFQDRNQRAECR